MSLISSTVHGDEGKCNGVILFTNAIFAPSIFSTNVNTTTTNTLSIYGPTGQVGVGTATGLGANLQVQGNVWASNFQEQVFTKLDPKTGKLLGEDNAAIGPRIFHGQWTSPSSGRVNGQSQVYFGGGDGVLYAFDASPSKR